MISFEDKMLWKIQVSLAIENALRELGKFELRKVIDTLQENYNISIPDCYDNPMILKNTLQRLFGNSYLTVVSLIEKHLDDLTVLEPVKEFLSVMKNN